MCASKGTKVQSHPRFTILEHQVLVTVTSFIGLFGGALGPFAATLVSPSFQFLLEPAWLATVFLGGGFIGFTVSAGVITALLPAKCPACGGPSFIIGNRGRGISIYRCRECGHTLDTALKLKS